MKLVASAPLSDSDVASLREHEPGLVVVQVKPAELPEAVGDADVIFGSFGGGGGDLFQRVVRAAKRARWIHTGSAGVDAILCPEFYEADFVLTCGKGEPVASLLAESVFGMLLTLTRGFLPAVRAGQWHGAGQLAGVLTELRGMTMGIVGYGATGLALTERARAFGMDVVGLRRTPGEPPAGVRAMYRPDQLTRLMAEVDVVVALAPNTPETYRMFGREQFRAMKPGAYFVNVGRGETMDPDALVEACRERWFAGAALDVLPWPEPWGPEMPLWNLPHVLITSHTAGVAPQRGGRNAAQFRENFGRFVRGEPMLGVVERDKGY